MSTTLTPRLQRLLAIALLVLVVTILWFAVVAPIADMIDSGADERQSALRALSRDRALVAQGPAVQSALTALDQDVRWTRFYRADKPEQATLQMETDLRGLFKAPNTLTSMTALPATVQGPLTKVAVKVSLSMPIDQLAELLSAVHSHAPLLKVEALTVQAPDFQPPDTNPTLVIQAEISGYLVADRATRT